MFRIVSKKSWNEYKPRRYVANQSVLLQWDNIQPVTLIYSTTTSIQWLQYNV